MQIVIFFQFGFQIGAFRYGICLMLSFLIKYNFQIQLGFLTSRNIYIIQGFSNYDRTTQDKYTFEPGVYIIKVFIDFDPSFQKDYDVNLAIYADYPCNISLASNQQASLLEGRRVSWTEQELKDDVPWNQLGAYGYDLKKLKQQSESEQEQKRSKRSQHIWKTSSRGYSGSGQNEQKVNSRTRDKFEEQSKKSTVIQIIIDPQQFIAHLQRQDQRGQLFSGNNTKTQFRRW